MTSFTDSLRAFDLKSAAGERRVRLALGVAVFAILTAVSAQVAVRLPWTPVPVTFQPLLVVLAGVVLGPRLGAASMVAYVTVGALGAPVFSNGGAGLPWLFGPTGGYLLVAPLAAFAAGAVAGRQRAGWRLLAGLTLGVATMYAGGVAQLMMLTGQDLGAAIALGAAPFWIGDVTKVLFAFAAVSGWRRFSKENDEA
ncbi:MAG: biotin transporter BioY [Gemmatimonadota bacterium]